MLCVCLHSSLRLALRGLFSICKLFQFVKHFGICSVHGGSRKGDISLVRKVGGFSDAVLKQVIFALFLHVILLQNTLHAVIAGYSSEIEVPIHRYKLCAAEGSIE